MNSVNQNNTGRYDRAPSPVAIVGSILAFGVLRALARADRSRDKAVPPGVQASTTPRRGKKRLNALK